MKFLFLIGLFAISITLTACGQSEQESQKEENPAEQVRENDKSEERTDQAASGAIAENDFFEEFSGHLEHVHGVGYPGNKGVAFFASHNGLKAYESGKWYKTKHEYNDYMGFSATEAGFYTSGHPGADSKLPNPIGIKKSTDLGETLQDVALEGETDFHTMSAGYSNDVIFALNPEKNSIMETNKFYISEDGGQSWKMAKAVGLNDEIIQVSVHPTDEHKIAAAGAKGIYYSEDKGESFEPISGDVTGTTVFFSEDSLWHGSYKGEPRLVRRSLADGIEENIPLPEMEGDAILYFAQNPKNEKELTFATFNGNVFQTSDNAGSWKQLVKERELN